MVALTAAAFATACGSEVIQQQGAGGVGGAGGTVSTNVTTGMQVVPAAITVSAPDQFTVVVTFALATDVPLPEGAYDLTSYAVSGEHGAFDIIGMVVDETQNTTTLTTSKQKLGVEYTVTFDGVEEWAGQDDTFPSADTARFWAADLNSPMFDEYELVADRRAIGDRVVVYLAQGMQAVNVAATVDYFDDKVWPIETALFNGAPDQDNNDRIVLFGLDGMGAYGGYFSPTDTLPNSVTLPQWGIHSNETEMLYIDVSQGVFQNEYVVAHEFAHLLHQESHGFEIANWNWHNEGMAECATHAVNGENDKDVGYYLQDPQGGIQAGKSMVNWEFANFDQYVLSYMFLTYLAGQKGGIATYGELFALEGSPASVNNWIQSELGVSFHEAHQNQALATWVQEASGIHSYNGMANFQNTSPIVGSGSLTLEPFGFAFRQPASPWAAPGTEGPNIVYMGINSAGAIDDADPFDLSGGALLVMNSSMNVDAFIGQPTGNPIPNIDDGTSASSTSKAAFVSARTRELTRLHPPPLHPQHRAQLRQWQRIAHGH